MALRSAGSNSLRGGKKKYGPKTKCGSWVELNKEPGRSLPMGFPNSMYQTDAHQQMLEGLQQRAKRYGAGLPHPEDPNIDYNRVINYDKHQRDSDWASITSTEFVHPSADDKKSKEFASSFRLTGGISDPVELRKYRETWTMEVDSIRPVRFQTDSVISANAGVLPIFRQKQTRVLPGAPKAVDRLREAILRNDNKLGFLGLRKALYESRRGETADDVLQATELSEGLRRSGAAIGEGDLTKICDYFTADGTSDICIRELIRRLRGQLSQPRQRVVREAFEALDKSVEGFLDAGGLKERITSSCRAGLEDTHLDRGSVQALIDNLPIYQDKNRVAMTDLQDMLGDISCNIRSDADFTAMVAWLLGNDKLYLRPEDTSFCR